VTAEADAIVGLLAEPERLQAVAALALGATTAEEVAKLAGLERRRAVEALERLAAGRLVEQVDGRLRLVVERFKEAAREAARRRPQVDPEALGATAQQAEVLRNFMSGGRLTSIPAQRSKRLAVLDFLSGQFEPGRTYPERDVNLMLGRFHADVAALRRYLVDEEFLERRDGFYWRAGGTFPVD
jgi:hypothetical protein